MKKKSQQVLRLRVVDLLKEVNPQRALQLKVVNSSHQLNLWLRQKVLLRRSSCSEREFLLTYPLPQLLREFANSQRKWSRSRSGRTPIRNPCHLLLLTR